MKSKILHNELLFMDDITGSGIHTWLREYFVKSTRFWKRKKKSINCLFFLWMVNSIINWCSKKDRKDILNFLRLEAVIREEWENINSHVQGTLLNQFLHALKKCIWRDGWPSIIPITLHSTTYSRFVFLILKFCWEPRSLGKCIQLWWLKRNVARQSIILQCFSKPHSHTVHCDVFTKFKGILDIY